MSVSPATTSNNPRVAVFPTPPPVSDSSAINDEDEEDDFDDLVEEEDFGLDNPSSVSALPSAPAIAVNKNNNSSSSNRIVDYANSSATNSANGAV